MKVYVKLFATLAKMVSEEFLSQHSKVSRTGSPRTVEIELPENSTLVDLIARLPLQKEEMVAFFVNSKLVRELDYHLTPGDEVGIFPPIGGG